MVPLPHVLWEDEEGMRFGRVREASKETLSCIVLLGQHGALEAIQAKANGAVDGIHGRHLVHQFS